MACFLVPATEAVVTTVAAKVISKKEEQNSSEDSGEIKFSQKMGWLNRMLWGGSALLAFEHLWHGEVQPFFPFLTAVYDPDSKSEMLGEMATSGVAMALLVTAVWIGMVLVSGMIQSGSETKTEKESASQ